MKFRHSALPMTAMALALASPVSAQDSEVEDIVKSYAEAWRGSGELELEGQITLRIQVDGEPHTVVLSNEGGSYVSEHDDWDFGYELDADILRKLDAGAINALTAMGQARASDAVPMDILTPKSLSDADRIRELYIPLTQAFWNRDWPETFDVDRAAARHVHGADAVVLAYAPGLRSAWYSLGPGQHINADPSDQTNPFDTMVVMTDGSLIAVVDGKRVVLRDGEALRIPTGVMHEFLPDGDSTGAFVILMYGDNA